MPGQSCMHSAWELYSFRQGSPTGHLQLHANIEVICDADDVIRLERVEHLSNCSHQKGWEQDAGQSAGG